MSARKVGCLGLVNLHRGRPSGLRVNMDSITIVTFLKLRIGSLFLGVMRTSSGSYSLTASTNSLDSEPRAAECSGIYSLK